MNLLKTPLRRATALVAGSFIGLAGAVAIAAPASAHYPSASGSTPCVSGDKWKIDWSIGNDYELNATVSKIIVADQDGKELPLTGEIIAQDKIVPPYSHQDGSKQIHGTTEVTKNSVQKATITVILKWTDGYTNDGQDTGNGHHNAVPLTATVDRPSTPCETPTPTPTGTTPSSAPSPSGSPIPTPSETTPPLPVPTPSKSGAAPAPFKPVVQMDCTTITLGIDNPSNGVAWGLHYKTTKGEERDDTVQPGERKTEKFSAVDGFKVTVQLTVTVNGKKYQDYTTIAWHKPANCGSGSGGGLPVTGAAAGGIAGGAAALLAIGGVLFMMARRRKLKFTA